MGKANPSWSWQSSLATLFMHCLNIHHFMPQERKDREMGGRGSSALTLLLITVLVEVKEAVWPHMIVNLVLFSKFVSIKTFLKDFGGGLSGGPVVNTAYFHCRGLGFDSWLGN